MCVKLHDHQLKRGDILGPYNAFFVMVLFYAGCDYPGDANAVAAHRHDNSFAVFIQYRGAEG